MVREDSLPRVAVYHFIFGELFLLMVRDFDSRIRVVTNAVSPPGGYIISVSLPVHAEFGGRDLMEERVWSSVGEV